MAVGTIITFLAQTRKLSLSEHKELVRDHPDAIASLPVSQVYVLYQHIILAIHYLVFEFY